MVLRYRNIIAVCVFGLLLSLSNTKYAVASCDFNGDYSIRNILKGSYLGQDKNQLSGGKGPGEKWRIIEKDGDCVLYNYFARGYLSQDRSYHIISEAGPGEKWDTGLWEFNFNSRCRLFLNKLMLSMNNSYILSQEIGRLNGNAGPGECWAVEPW